MTAQQRKEDGDFYENLRKLKIAELTLISGEQFEKARAKINQEFRQRQIKQSTAKPSEMITFKMRGDIRVSIYKSEVEGVMDGDVGVDTTSVVHTKSGNLFTVKGSRKDILKQLGE